MRAYCWASGLIEFGKKIPAGALPVMHGRKDDVVKQVTASARIGWKGELLVPGVPEAKDQFEAVDALSLFCRRLRQQAAKSGDRT